MIRNVNRFPNLRVNTKKNILIKSDFYLQNRNEVQVRHKNIHIRQIYLQNFNKLN